MTDSFIGISLDLGNCFYFSRLIKRNERKYRREVNVVCMCARAHAPVCVCPKELGRHAKISLDEDNVMIVATTTTASGFGINFRPGRVAAILNGAFAIHNYADRYNALQHVSRLSFVRANCGFGALVNVAVNYLPRNPSPLSFAI